MYTFLAFNPQNYLQQSFFLTNKNLKNLIPRENILFKIVMLLFVTEYIQQVVFKTYHKIGVAKAAYVAGQLRAIRKIKPGNAVKNKLDRRCNVEVVLLFGNKRLPKQLNIYIHIGLFVTGILFWQHQ